MDTRERRALVVSVAAMPGALPRQVAARPAPERRRFRKPTAGQILGWQAAILLATLAAHQPWPTAVCTIAGACALVTATVMRRRVRFLLRRRRHRVHDGRSLLNLVLSRVVTGKIDTSDGPLATVADPGGLTAILRSRITAKPLLSTFPAPDDLLTAGIPRCEVLTVFHTAAQHDRPSEVWLAVRITRTAEIPHDDQLISLLHKALRNIQHPLRQAGVPAGPVGVESALTALATLAHTNRELREDWRFLRTGGIAQACFALTGPERADLQRLVGTLLTRYPGVAVTVTRARDSTLLRLAATTETAVDTVAAHAARLLSPTGIHLTRLNGAHLAGLAASLPIGGFPR